MFTNFYESLKWALVASVTTAYASSAIATPHIVVTPIAKLADTVADSPRFVTNNDGQNFIVFLGVKANRQRTINIWDVEASRFIYQRSVLETVTEDCFQTSELGGVRFNTNNEPLVALRWKGPASSCQFRELNVATGTNEVLADLKSYQSLDNYRNDPGQAPDTKFVASSSSTEPVLFRDSRGKTHSVTREDRIFRIDNGARLPAVGFNGHFEIFRDVYQFGERELVMSSYSYFTYDIKTGEAMDVLGDREDSSIWSGVLNQQFLYGVVPTHWRNRDFLVTFDQNFTRQEIPLSNKRVITNKLIGGQYLLTSESGSGNIQKASGICLLQFNESANSALTTACADDGLTLYRRAEYKEPSQAYPSEYYRFAQAKDAVDGKVLLVVTSQSISEPTWAIISVK